MRVRVACGCFFSSHESSSWSCSGLFPPPTSCWLRRSVFTKLRLSHFTLNVKKSWVVGSEVQMICVIWPLSASARVLFVFAWRRAPRLVCSQCLLVPHSFPECFFCLRNIFLYGWVYDPSFHWVWVFARLGCVSWSPPFWARIVCLSVGSFPMSY